MRQLKLLEHFAKTEGTHWKLKGHPNPTSHNEDS